MFRPLMPAIFLACTGAALGCARGSVQDESAKPRQETRPVSDGEKQIADSVNRFGFRLLGLPGKSAGKNVFISPASISTALAMTWNGAGGETAAEMAKALEFGALDKETVNRGFQALLAGLPLSDPKVQVNTANALWLGRNPNPQFLQIVQAFYSAEASRVDFGNAEAAVGRINAWVKEKTRDKIDQILSAQDVGGATDIVLTNAVYFKGIWTTQFDSKRTFESVFVLADGPRKRVQMMQGDKVRVKSLRTDQFDSVSLPYGDGRFRMYLFLPNEGSGLSAFLSALTPEKWQEWMKGFRDDSRSVVLPRFKVESEQSMVEPLKALGMKLAFGGGDLGPMGFPGSAISEVKHKAVMEVNEEGTVAAAATAVVVTRGGDLRFVVNRPFFTVIRDERNGALLFMGAVWDPAPLM